MTSSTKLTPDELRKLPMAELTSLAKLHLRGWERADPVALVQELTRRLTEAEQNLILQLVLMQTQKPVDQFDSRLPFGH